MFTKPEHHEAARARKKTMMKPRLRLALATLEGLVIDKFRQPVTGLEIQSVRGQACNSRVTHTRLRYKLITSAGHRKITGCPMRDKTTDRFPIHYGLNDLSQLPTL